MHIELIEKSSPGNGFQRTLIEVADQITERIEAEALLHREKPFLLLALAVAENKRRYRLLATLGLRA
jgi:hypothetical protein